MRGFGANTSILRGQPAPIPALPAIYLPRPRLSEALAVGRRRLRVLCAPAGFGKSALLVEWRQALPESEPVLWLGLAGRPCSLPQLSASLAALLGLAPESDPDALLEFFSNSVAPIRIVLDDLSNETSAELNHWLEQLLSLPASQLQLLVSCRQRPSWNLPRLMLEGELLELDAGALAFSRAEFAALVRLLAPAITDSAQAQLWHDTGGWCAGIRLLLLAPLKQGQALAADSPLLREYLQHELLARLDPQECEILQGLAHLPKASAQLCEQLWEEQPGGALFKRLLHCQAFLFPVDQAHCWYRLLPAVAYALQGQLSGTALHHLRLRACRLLSNLGHFDDAIELAIEADQPEVAVNYMERLGLAWLLTDRHLSRLMAWRDQLPLQLLESTPRLVALCARALLVSGRLDESEDCLRRLQDAPQQNPRLQANWQALHGSLQAYRGDAAAARLHCRAALSHLPAQDWLCRLLCQSTLARVAMISGDLDEADQLLGEAVELARRQGSLDGEVLINTDRFRLLILQGDLSLAQALLQEDLRRVAATSNQRNPLLGRLLFLQGELLVLLGRLEEGEQVLHAGLQQVRGCAAPFILHGYLILAEIAARQGRFEPARLLLHEGERRMHCGNIDEACYKSAVALQHMRILARQECWAQVLPLGYALEEQLQGAKPCLPPLQMPSLAQRNQLLLAQAQYRTGAVELASQRLRALLEQCQRRRFDTLAGEVRQVMAHIGCSADPRELGLSLVNERRLGVPQGRAEGPVQPGTPGTSAYPDGLTAREISVLKLLAQGMSIREVGSSLFISVNTVKTHAKNINAKLGACRRTQAINSAKLMGILG